MSDHQQQTTKKTVKAPIQQTEMGMGQEHEQPTVEFDGGLLQRMHQAPNSLNPNQVLQLQRLVGNQAVGQVLQRVRQVNNGQVQRKPMSIPWHPTRPAVSGPLIQPSLRPVFEGLLQRLNNTSVQRDGERVDHSKGFDTGKDFQQRLDKANSFGGKSLPNDFQQEVGEKAKIDTKNVQVHTGTESAQMAADIGAKAFTHKNHIHMGEGQYNLNTSAGKHLALHETVHTHQQGASPSLKTKRDDEPLDLQASSNIQRTNLIQRWWWDKKDESSTTSKKKSKKRGWFGGKKSSGGIEEVDRDLAELRQLDKELELGVDTLSSNPSSPGLDVSPRTRKIGLDVSSQNKNNAPLSENESQDNVETRIYDYEKEREYVAQGLLKAQLFYDQKYGDKAIHTFLSMTEVVIHRKEFTDNQWREIMLAWKPAEISREEQKIRNDQEKYKTFLKMRDWLRAKAAQDKKSRLFKYFEDNLSVNQQMSVFIGIIGTEGAFNTSQLKKGLTPWHRIGLNWDKFSEITRRNQSQHIGWDFWESRAWRDYSEIGLGALSGSVGAGALLLSSDAALISGVAAYGLGIFASIFQASSQYYEMADKDYDRPTRQVAGLKGTAGVTDVLRQGGMTTAYVGSLIGDTALEAVSTTAAGVAGLASGALYLGSGIIESEKYKKQAKELSEIEGTTKDEQIKKAAKLAGGAAKAGRVASVTTATKGAALILGSALIIGLASNPVGWMVLGVGAMIGAIGSLYRYGAWRERKEKTVDEALGIKHVGLWTRTKATLWDIEGMNPFYRKKPKPSKSQKARNKWKNEREEKLQDLGFNSVDQFYQAYLYTTAAYINHKAIDEVKSDSPGEAQKILQGMGFEADYSLGVSGIPPIEKIAQKLDY